MLEREAIFELLRCVPGDIVSRIQALGLKSKYSISEVSFILSISHEWTRVKVITGEITGHKIGGGRRAQSWCIYIEDLIHYITSTHCLNRP